MGKKVKAGKPDSIFNATSSDIMTLFMDLNNLLGYRMVLPPLSVSLIIHRNVACVQICIKALVKNKCLTKKLQHSVYYATPTSLSHYSKLQIEEKERLLKIKQEQLKGTRSS